MFATPHRETHPTVNVSLEALSVAPEAYRRLDDAFRAVETTRRDPARSELAPRHSSLELPDDRFAIVEPGAPLVTVYLADEGELSRVEETPTPLCNLASFWRIWRPPMGLLDPHDRSWLRGSDRLADQTAPPVPARHLDGEGWQDPLPADLDPLAGILRGVADALRTDAAA